MGSKREILDFVIGAISDIEVDNRLVCDLFAGSGVVTGSLKNVCNVHSNDIQAYSAVLSNAYFSDCRGIDIKSTLSYIQEKAVSHISTLSDICSTSIINYKSIDSLIEFSKIEKQQLSIIKKDFSSKEYYLFTKTYSGTYWSFEQCLWIDAIRKTADLINEPTLSHIIIASLMFAMSYTSQSTGHYAQYRDANSYESMKDIISYRQKSIWANFSRKFKELTQSQDEVKYKLTTSNLDYLECLDIIPERTIVYADPPYASVHYSRFYHALETLVRYDYPEVNYKGRYRKDRHQSPFCQKKQVDKAFSSLFSKISHKGADLVLSYSSTGMIKMEDITNLAEKEFGHSYQTVIKEANHFHSTMGRLGNRQQPVKEYLIIFKAN